VSWEVYLRDESGEVIELGERDPRLMGGTHRVGGPDRAELNLTWNYGRFFHMALDAEHGLHWLDGKRAQDTAERLEKAIRMLGTQRSSNYWDPTAGNAGYALSLLLGLAERFPEGRWEVD